LSIQIGRRKFIVGLGSAAAWPLAARGQQPEIPVIGLLASAAPINPANLAEFRRGLSDAGYVEGTNASIKVRAADRYDQLPALAGELVRRQVSAIFAIALPAALAAKVATTTIPIVFFTGDDPVRAGLVTSLNRPSGNLTGVTSLSSALFLKKLGLLRELTPRVGVIGVLFNPENPNTERRLIDLQEAAGSIGQLVTILNARREDDFAQVFAAAVQQHIVALLISDDNFFGGRAEQLAALAKSHALPTIFGSTQFVTAGGLVSYNTAPGQVYPQIGLYVGRILKGEKPADLPVVQPTRFELVINLKTAKSLGLTVPPTLLVAADEVIE
jgi:putative ABC transport system substrate-binding protein